MDGHPCVKTQVTVTDDKGNKYEPIVWNATDLKKFPIKIETTSQAHTTTILFTNVKLSKPEASLFDPPAGFKHYDSPQALIQQEMMKHMGGAPGGPPPAGQ